jgi:hypothetical protein
MTRRVRDGLHSTKGTVLRLAHWTGGCRAVPFKLAEGAIPTLPYGQSPDSGQKVSQKAQIRTALPLKRLAHFCVARCLK